MASRPCQSMFIETQKSLQLTADKITDNNSILFPPYKTSPIMRPPTIAEAICPETFAPTACINR